MMLGWHLKRLLGVGTFAEVWCAQPVNMKGQPFGEDIALKIGLYHVESQRSQRESAVSCRTAPLQHEAIIKILDVTIRENKLVVEMELADGMLLGIPSQAPSISGYCQYIEEAAAALDFLHQKHIIHGGINPTDILVRDGHAKIADFGPFPDETAAATVPIYKAVCMAPELRRGEPSPASDQYALAATYVCLRLQHRMLTIPRAGELAGHVDYQLLPAPERKILSTALSAEPKRRFPTCCAFAESLHQAV